MDWTNWLRKLSGGVKDPDRPNEPSHYHRMLASSLADLRLADSDTPWPDLGSVLLRIPPAKLLDIDERLRLWSQWAFKHWPGDGCDLLDIASAGADIQQSLLFLQAGHRDGRVRERSLGLLPDFPGALSLGAALIRCNDWSAVVRCRAEEIAEHLLAACDVQSARHMLPLAKRVAQGGRVSGQWLSDVLHGWLKKHPDVILDMLDNPDRATRAWGYELLASIDTVKFAELLGQAMLDPDPRIALWAMRQAQAYLSAERYREALMRAIDARHPIVRQNAWRACGDIEQGISRDFLERGLLDGSRGVRSFAAYLLRQRFAEDAAAHWRAHIDHGGARTSLALVSLLDVAGESDRYRFAGLLFSASPRVRALALRGYLKAKGSLSDSDLVSLLNDDHKSVRLELSESVRRGDINLSVSRVVGLLGYGRLNAHGLWFLKQLIRALNKWDQLEMILTLEPDSLETTAWWEAFQDDWLNANDYLPLGAERRKRLSDLIAACARLSDGKKMEFLAAMA